MWVAICSTSSGSLKSGIDITGLAIEASSLGMLGGVSATALSLKQSSCPVGLYTMEI